MEGIEVYKKYDEILKRLTLCTKEEEIDFLFEKEGITCYKEQCELLRTCMRILHVHTTFTREIDEDDYEMTKKAFVEGSWRFIL